MPHVRDNQLGMEPTVEAYIDRMVQVFRLVRETMSPYAVAFVNIGDSYASGEIGRHDRRENNHCGDIRNHTATTTKFDGPRQVSRPQTGIPAGNLCLIPQRLALALQADGWIVRSVVVWHKPSPMPQSVAGWRWMRCRVKIGSGGGRLTPKQREADALSIHDASSTGLHTPGWRDGETRATQWADCPGCKKCQPHGGYVLRRGSWRPTSSWEPILMLAKSSQYFCDGEAVRQPHAQASIDRSKYSLQDIRSGSALRQEGEKGPKGDNVVTREYPPLDPAGANLRDVWRTTLSDLTKEELIDLLEQQQDNNLPDVWTISSEPLHEKHYAAFPSRLVELALRAGTSAKGYCPVCGSPWCRVISTRFIPQGDVSLVKGVRGAEDQKTMDESNGWEGMPRGSTEAETIGWRPTCQCPEAEPRPGLVLDPFAGSGRTGLVARKLGLDFVGCELNPEYVLMARRLLYDDLPLFSELPGDAP